MPRLKSSRGKTNYLIKNGVGIIEIEIGIGIGAIRSRPERNQTGIFF